MKLEHIIESYRAKKMLNRYKRRKQNIDNRN